jgi:hypothetical protein
MNCSRRSALLLVCFGPTISKWKTEGGLPV